MTTRAELTAGTGAITPTRPPHPWRDSAADYGRRPACDVCGSEDRAGHLPTPRTPNRRTEK